MYFDYKKFNNTISNNFSSFKRSITKEFKHNGVSPSFGYSKHFKNHHFFECTFSYMGTNHQVETIVDITLDSTSFISKADITQRSLGIRFEYALPIFNTIEDKSSFYLGISYEPYIFSYQAKTQNFYSFPEKYFELSTVIAVVPRFTQYITKNCFLDLNVPIPIFGFSGNRHTVSNPILPIYTKSQYGSSSTFFPSNYQVRLGLGLRF